MRALIIILIVLIPNILVCQNDTAKSKAKPTRKELRYKPKTLEECFSQLDKILDDSIKNEMKISGDSNMISYHHGLGTWIRNNWGLWGHSDLSKYFNQLGINHPDDMSGIILDSYYCYLNGKDIQLDKQIEYYQQYWKVVAKPTEDNYPEGEKNLEFYSGMYYKKDGKGNGFIHIQTNSQNEKIWIYDYYYGWKRVTQEIINKLEQNVSNREVILKEIFY